MRTFDVFVLPTDSEPFGKVIVEAMAAGCPVVTTPVGGIPEIITDDTLGTMIAPGDVQATAQAIVAYLTDRQRARRVGRNARQHVQAHFGMDRMIGSLQQLYEQVLAESDGRGPASRRQKRDHAAGSVSDV
jgi:glycosyltransferase involved in cell wall biosynthesis